MKDSPIAEWVAQAQQGDREAFAAVVQLYQARLLRQVEARMGNRARAGLEAEDVVQETVVRAFESIDMFRWCGGESFYRWLAGIAEHLIWNAAKKKPWEPLKLADGLAGAHSDASPGRRMRRDERMERLEQALRGLSGDHREVILLARIERLPIDEIAERMRRSPGAVSKLLSRALRGLRESFGDTESLHLPPRPLRMEPP